MSSLLQLAFARAGREWGSFSRVPPLIRRTLSSSSSSSSSFSTCSSKAWKLPSASSSLFRRQGKRGWKLAAAAVAVGAGFLASATRAPAECIGGGVSFINSPESLVTEAIDGLVMSQPGLCRLDGYPEVKVVVRSDWIQPRNAHKVAVISGGGAGHEPAHVGFVGEGMLTAAVSGDVFSSPSAYAVLAAIRSVAYPGGELQRRARKSPGVLLVVKNYTGDRINFTIAAEQARAEGIPVSMVVVGDDCAIPREKGVTGRRGIAGTCFVHKIAGAAAEAGRSLEAVTEEAKSAAGCIASVGVSASVCHIPGRRESKRIKPGKLEMGLGIHGEPGTKTVPKEPVARLVKDMRKLILNSSPERSYMSLKGEDRVAVIVNSLGSATPMEISIATKEIMRDLRSMGVVIERVVTGPLMTSMDMAGFSMSILKLPAEKLPRETMLLRLDAHTNAPGWPRGGGALTEHNAYGNIYPLEPETRKTWYRPAHLNASGKTMERIINNAALALYNSERELTEWDLKVGDGDCGTTFKLGAKAALHDLSGYPLNSISDTLEAMGSTVAKSMGGTSGALYRIFLLSLCATTRAKEIDNMIGDAKMDDQAKLKAISDAFSIAVEKLSTSGGAAEGDRTMLDALIPAARSLQGSVDTGAPLIAALEKAVAAAEVGAEATKEMDARAGRSNYVPEHVLRKTPDPGAKAAAIWMRAAYDAFRE